MVWQVSHGDDRETYNVQFSRPSSSPPNPSRDVEDEDDPNHSTGDRYDDKGEGILDMDKVNTFMVFRICDMETWIEKPAWCFSSTTGASPSSATGHV